MHRSFPTELTADLELRDLRRTLPGQILLIVSATAFVALCAHVSFPLFFTPVPVTLQTMAVILVGLTLGPVSGSYAMLLYLAEGASGLPVFSPHGPGGIAQLLGPTGGFLLSYPLAAAAAGWVVRTLRWRSQVFSAVLAGAAATVFVFALGAAWAASELHLGAGMAWKIAILPFLPGEVLKITAAATGYRTLREWFAPSGGDGASQI